MKKKHKMAITIFFVILLLTAARYYLYEKSFAHPVLQVMTQTSNNGDKEEVVYYEIGTDERYRTCDAFTPQKCKVYTLYSLDWDNQDLETWTELDEDGNIIEREKDPIWNDMLCQVSDNEKEHHTSVVTLFETLDDIYYIQVEKNVNLWTPFVLYRYNPKSAELTYLTTLSGMEVIGLRE